jgi:hypothetical protein
MVLAGPVCLGATPSFDGGIVIKNGDAEYSEGGAWQDGKNVGDYYRYGCDAGEPRKTTSSGAWATWTPKLTAGTYRVYFWHIVWGARGNVTFEIRHNGGATTIKRNTGDGHSGWNNLGDYDFAAGTDGYVKVTLDDKGILYANAARFLPVEKVDKTSFPPYPAPDGSTPRAEKGNIVVCGQPCLILYGETLEETVAHPADVPAAAGDVFDKWRREEALWLQREDVALAASTSGMIRVQAKTVNGESWQPKAKVNRAVPVNRALRAYPDSYTPRPSFGDWSFPSPRAAATTWTA